MLCVFDVYCVLLHVLDVCVNEDYTIPRRNRSRYDIYAGVSLWSVSVASFFVFDHIIRVCRRRRRCCVCVCVCSDV